MSFDQVKAPIFKAHIHLELKQSNLRALHQKKASIYLGNYLNHPHYTIEMSGLFLNSGCYFCSEEV